MLDVCGLVEVSGSECVEEDKIEMRLRAGRANEGVAGGLRWVAPKVNASRRSSRSDVARSNNAAMHGITFCDIGEFGG